MKKLIEGIQRFQEDAFHRKRQLFEQLAEGQRPHALFITCSDSRIDPNLLTSTEPGELFVVRNAGNIVPPYGSVRGGEAATIEYAVKVLEIEDIVICGHSHCGAMAGLLAPDTLHELPSVRDWLVHAEDPHGIVPDNYGHISDDPDPLTVAVERNIIVQLDHLQTYPSVADAIDRKALLLHGCVYQFETGRVFGYDVASQKFLPVDPSID